MGFSIRYAIPMHGPGCRDSVKSKLSSMDGVDDVEVDLSQQEAVVTGEVAPSAVVSMMQCIGRDAFVRGSGLPNSAAVAILETNRGEVKGLARLIEIAKDTTLFDVTMDRAYAGRNISVYSYGDISNAPQSLGPPIFKVADVPPNVRNDPTTSTWATHANAPLAGLIGRSIHTDSGLTGIIARSAGLWENDKTVCACSGKTVWEEREDFRVKSNGHL